MATKDRGCSFGKDTPDPHNGTGSAATKAVEPKADKQAKAKENKQVEKEADK